MNHIKWFLKQQNSKHRKEKQNKIHQKSKQIIIIYMFVRICELIKQKQNETNISIDRWMSFGMRWPFYFTLYFRFIHCL